MSPSPGINLHNLIESVEMLTPILQRNDYGAIFSRLKLRKSRALEIFDSDKSNCWEGSLGSPSKAPLKNNWPLKGSARRGSTKWIHMLAIVYLVDQATRSTRLRAYNASVSIVHLLVRLILSLKGIYHLSLLTCCSQHIKRTYFFRIQLPSVNNGHPRIF